MVTRDSVELNCRYRGVERNPDCGEWVKLLTCYNATHLTELLLLLTNCKSKAKVSSRMVNHVDCCHGFGRVRPLFDFPVLLNSLFSAFSGIHSSLSHESRSKPIFTLQKIRLLRRMKVPFPIRSRKFNSLVSQLEVASRPTGVQVQVQVHSPSHISHASHSPQSTLHPRLSTLVSSLTHHSCSQDV